MREYLLAERIPRGPSSRPGTRAMARNDERKAAKKTASPELWNLLTRGLLAAILLSTVGPKVVRELRGDPPAESVAEEDTREAPGEDEREEDKDEAGEEEEDENRPRPRSGTAVAAWRPLGGGGGGGGGSYSKADVTACNRAAQAARVRPSKKLPSDLASAMEKHSSLVGAAAGTLRQVTAGVRDDARAAAVYKACIIERTY